MIRKGRNDDVWKRTMTNRFNKCCNKIVKVVFADPSDYDSRFDEKFDPVKCCGIVGNLNNEIEASI